MRYTRRRYTKPTLLTLIAIAISISYVHHFVSAQTAKFASRSKLLDDESKKKKRSFFGKRTNRQVVREEKRDGEWYSWSKMKDEGGGGYDSKEDDVSWKWELFIAESRIILVSVIASIACAIISLVWYISSGIILQPGLQIDNKEEGGECSPYLAPSLLGVYMCFFYNEFICLTFCFTSSDS